MKIIENIYFVICLFALGVTTGYGLMYFSVVGGLFE